MDKNYLVTKSNYFIMNCSYDLSLEEQKLILTLSSMVQPEDEDFKPYKFKITDFMKLLGVDTKTKYTEVPKITKELMKKVFEIEENDIIIQTAWLSSATYKKGSGMVELEFSPRLKPYMLKLNTMFTQYKLVNILSMKSKYSPRIYEILKCNEFKKQGYIEIEIIELRKLLKAENIYPLYADFKRFVLKQSQKELKKISDISFDFEEVKTGRKVTSIKFYINKNKSLNDPKQKQIESEVLADEEKFFDLIEEDIKSIMSITNNEFTEKNVVLFRDLCNGDINKIEQCYKYMKTKEINSNKIGYMRKLLKDFEEPKKSKANISDNEIGTGFNNFKPREYDYDNLERRLLGWDE